MDFKIDKKNIRKKIACVIGPYISGAFCCKVFWLFLQHLSPPMNMYIAHKQTENSVPTRVTAITISLNTHNTHANMRKTTIFMHLHVSYATSKHRPCRLLHHDQRWMDRRVVRRRTHTYMHMCIEYRERESTLSYRNSIFDILLAGTQTARTSYQWTDVAYS